MSKIRPFRDEPNILDKAGVSLTYLILGGMVAQAGLAGAERVVFTYFFVIGIILWVAVVNRRNAVKYFVRYHVMQALLLNVVMGALILLLAALLNFFFYIPLFNLIAAAIQTGVSYPIIFPGNVVLTVLQFAVVSLNVIMVAYAFGGKYTQLPYITDWVRNWI